MDSKKNYSSELLVTKLNKFCTIFRQVAQEAYNKFKCLSLISYHLNKNIWGSKHHSVKLSPVNSFVQAALRSTSIYDGEKLQIFILLARNAREKWSWNAVIGGDPEDETLWTCLWKVCLFLSSTTRRHLGDIMYEEQAFTRH